MPPLSPMTIGIALFAIGFIVAGALLVAAVRCRNVDRPQQLSPAERLDLARTMARHPAGRAFMHTGVHRDRWREREERNG